MMRSKTRVTAARAAAFDILEQVECKGSYAAPLIAALQNGRLTREDRALTQEIVLGVLRWRRTLDYLIRKHSSRGFDQIEIAALISVRMGLYQIRYLTRVPVSAAVNESVNLVKRAGAHRAAGFVNAVLRKAAVNVEVDLAGEIADPRERASIRLSHPRWLLNRWANWLGEADAYALALANNEPAPTTFRINTILADEKAVLAELETQQIVIGNSTLGPAIYTAERGGDLAATGLAAGGRIYTQDASSQLISLLVNPNPGDQILDLCSAPGSKSTHLAALSGDQCWIVAADRHHHRLAVLVGAYQRLGIRSITPLTLDASCSLPFASGAKFDRVLVDAPCSGTGTLRQNPEIKWRLTPDDITRLSALQLTFLLNAAPVVKNGGRLVYSTCSLEPEEDEQVVSRFREMLPSFRRVTPEVNPSLLTPEGYLRTFPHRQNADGFFAAVLENNAV